MFCQRMSRFLLDNVSPNQGQNGVSFDEWHAKIDCFSLQGPTILSCYYLLWHMDMISIFDVALSWEDRVENRSGGCSERFGCIDAINSNAKTRPFSGSWECCKHPERRFGYIWNKECMWFVHCCCATALYRSCNVGSYSADSGLRPFLSLSQMNLSGLGPSIALDSSMFLYSNGYGHSVGYQGEQLCSLWHWDVHNWHA